LVTAELKGKRVKLADGKITAIDGPFTESKKLIASDAGSR